MKVLSVNARPLARRAAIRHPPPRYALGGVVALAPPPYIAAERASASVTFRNIRFCEHRLRTFRRRLFGLLTGW
jgi:hypothetical protein